MNSMPGRHTPNKGFPHLRPNTRPRVRGYRGGVGVIGELFPGKKLTDEGSGDSDGQGYEPRVDVDLDAGVVRLSRPARAEDQPSE